MPHRKNYIDWTRRCKLDGKDTAEHFRCGRAAAGITVIQGFYEHVR